MDHLIILSKKSFVSFKKTVKDSFDLKWRGRPIYSIATVK